MTEYEGHEAGKQAICELCDTAPAAFTAWDGRCKRASSVFAPIAGNWISTRAVAHIYINLQNNVLSSKIGAKRICLPPLTAQCWFRYASNFAAHCWYMGCWSICVVDICRVWFVHASYQIRRTFGGRRRSIQSAELSPRKWWVSWRQNLLTFFSYTNFLIQERPKDFHKRRKVLEVKINVM